MGSGFKRLSIFRPYVLVFWLGFQISCKTDMDTINRIGREQAQVEKATDIEVSYTENGILSARILAETMDRFLIPPAYSEFNKGLRLFFFTETGQLDSRLSANYGKIYNDDTEMLLKDNVVIISAKGEKLNTEELYWKRNDKKITTDKFVKITTPDEIIYGKGLEATEDFSSYRILDVEGVIKVAADEI